MLHPILVLFFLITEGVSVYLGIRLKQILNFTSFKLKQEVVMASVYRWLFALSLYSVLHVTRQPRAEAASVSSGVATGTPSAAMGRAGGAVLTHRATGLACGGGGSKTNEAAPTSTYRVARPRTQPGRSAGRGHVAGAINKGRHRILLTSPASRPPFITLSPPRPHTSPSSNRSIRLLLPPLFTRLTPAWLRDKPNLLLLHLLLANYVCSRDRWGGRRAARRAG